MIHDLALLVRKELRAKKFPHPVEYGPERAQREGFAAAIVFYRDREREDVIAPPPNAKVNPQSPFVRRIAGRVDVFARSARAAASAGDHEEECDAVCDGVLCALYRICQTKRLPLEIVSSKLMTAAEFNDCETWAGAGARILFSVTSMVLDVDYRGNGPLTGTVEEVAPPVITSAGFPDFDPAPEIP